MTGISSDVIRGYNDTIILYLLLKEPSYGYEISKKIRNLSEEKYVIKQLYILRLQECRKTDIQNLFTEMRREEREEPIIESRRQEEHTILKNAKNGH